MSACTDREKTSFVPLFLFLYSFLFLERYQETKQEMLTPEIYNFFCIIHIIFLFAAESWRVKIRGYKLR